MGITIGIKKEGNSPLSDTELRCKSIITAIQRYGNRTI